MQTLDPIDDANGRSIGCVLERDGAIIAILPDGTSQGFDTRAGAITWLHECAHARDPQHLSRPPHVVELVVLAVTIVSLLFYFYLWVRA